MSSSGPKHAARPSRNAAIKKQPSSSPSATSEELKDAAVQISLVDLEERVADTRDKWENEFLFEDALDELTKKDAQSSLCTPVPTIYSPLVYSSLTNTTVSESCTPKEATQLRKDLRELGPVTFCQRTIDAGLYTAKKLLSVFKVRPPAFLDGQPDEAYLGLLSLAMSRELAKRAKIDKYNSVKDAVELIRQSNNIIIITGAGISTSLGIPDFRSKGTGLYSKLEHLGLADPQEVFEINMFREDPTIFYSVAKDIIPDSERYTPTHKFIAMLHDRGKLLTNYSQNIDNLEVKAGVPKEKLIQCHGSFATATCIQCEYKVEGEKIFPDIKAGNIPRCPRCIQNLRATGGSMKRRRPKAAKQKKRARWTDDSSDEDSEYDIPTAGVMKPDITFFGEDLPDEFSERLTEHDRDKVDLVVIIGTSLKVTPVSEIVNWLPAHIPQIYVSRQTVTHINFDIDLLGDCDVVVSELCRQLDWPLEHEMIPTDQKINIRTDGEQEHRHFFEEIKAEVKST